MIYGGKHSWIDIAHRKDPNTKLYFFIKATFKTPIPEYWEKIEDKINQLNKGQIDFPESEKIRYYYLNIEFENDMIKLIRYFRALIQYLSEQEYEIICNLTAGVFELKIALYLASQIESDKVKEIFYLNKQNFNKNILFKTINISDKGKNLLTIIFKMICEQYNKNYRLKYDEEYSLTELNKLCVNYDFKIDLPGLSRLVSKLIKDGFLKERREGRIKYISLTDIGLIFCPVNSLYGDFQEKLKVKS